jgi:hypothetical protein
MVTEEELLESMMRLHMWRESYNGNNVGLGLDEYAPHSMYHYPEAYALWGRGYLALYSLLGNKEFLAYAEECAKWLMDNKSSRYKNSSWGLPWEWNGRPENYSYLSTTAFVGFFFIDLYKANRRSEFLETAQSVADWILKENGVAEEDIGVWFSYSDHPSLRLPIFNAVSLASGFLSELYVCSNVAEYGRFAAESAKYVMNCQNDDGSWHYSPSNQQVDNVHLGYTLEGLCAYFKNSSDMSTKPVLNKGGQYLWSSLYESNGYGKEYVTQPSTEWRNRLKRIFNDIGLLQVPESRLWGYAAAIRSFGLLSYVDPYFLECSSKIFDFVRKKLASKDGYCYFRSNDTSCFIRHQSHIFDSLGTTCIRLRNLQSG